MIIGNKNAITYKEIFRYIKQDKLWIGYMPMSTDLLFDVPLDYANELIANKKEGSGYKIINGVLKGRAQAVWFTNLDTTKRHEDLILYKKYSAEEYPKYDNYDAINIDKTSDIPMDYDGFMGVPITFLDKYNPQQFEILGIMNSGEKENNSFCWNKESTLKHGRPVINGREIYFRIIIRNKKVEINGN